MLPLSTPAPNVSPSDIQFHRLESNFQRGHLDSNQTKNPVPEIALGYQSTPSPNMSYGNHPAYDNLQYGGRYQSPYRPPYGLSQCQAYLPVVFVCCEVCETGSQGVQVAGTPRFMGRRGQLASAALQSFPSTFSSSTLTNPRIIWSQEEETWMRSSSSLGSDRHRYSSLVHRFKHSENPQIRLIGFDT